jgi:hypothetical protein
VALSIPAPASASAPLSSDPGPSESPPQGGLGHLFAREGGRGTLQRRPSLREEVAEMLGPLRPADKNMRRISTAFAAGFTDEEFERFNNPVRRRKVTAAGSPGPSSHGTGAGSGVGSGAAAAGTGADEAPAIGAVRVVRWLSSKILIALWAPRRCFPRRQPPRVSVLRRHATSPGACSTLCRCPCARSVVSDFSNTITTH